MRMGNTRRRPDGFASRGVIHRPCSFNSRGTPADCCLRPGVPSSSSSNRTWGFVSRRRAGDRGQRTPSNHERILRWEGWMAGSRPPSVEYGGGLPAGALVAWTGAQVSEKPPRGGGFRWAKSSGRTRTSNRRLRRPTPGSSPGLRPPSPRARAVSRAPGAARFEETGSRLQTIAGRGPEAEGHRRRRRRPMPIAPRQARPPVPGTTVDAPISPA